MENAASELNWGSEEISVELPAGETVELFDGTENKAIIIDEIILTVDG